MPASQTAVVITCYELGRTVGEALDSVLAQTASAQEIVVVDDGSRDALTLQALDWLEEAHPDVRTIRATHGGPASARNRGIAATGAPLVVLLDGDDLFEPTYLQKASELLHEREDLSFVCCALQAFGRASYRWKPPPYTFGEALGRGACGHISTVFRRDVWEQSDGFDESLPAYEDVDFWLGALESGFRGAVLDEALVRYRVRRGSRYHSTVVRGEYLKAKQILLEKHLGANTRGEDVFVTLLDFQRELAGHAAWLRSEREQLREQLTDVEGEIERVSHELSQRGIAAFRWPEPPAPPVMAGGTRGEAAGKTAGEASSHAEEVERLLIDRVLADSMSQDPSDRTLTISAGDEWPETDRPTYDLIVAVGALERAREPSAALSRCRRALRPGGRLVLAAGASALGRDRQQGFTEASLRLLLCDRFPPGMVQVASYGNLATCLSAVIGLPLEELGLQDLEADDPTHPTIVAGWAQVPERGRRSLRPARRRAQARQPLRGRPHRPRRGAILAYHRVAALNPDVHRLCTPPELFAAQMELLAERYRPASLVELTARAASGELDPDMVAVTFDDGYLDNLEMASPILLELGIPATFFVNGNPGNEPREAWWDTIERIMLGGEPIPDRLEIEVDELALTLLTGNDEQRRAALMTLHGHLLDADGQRIDAVVDRLVAWSQLELTARSSHRLMTAEELVSLGGRQGHRVAAHGLRHLFLPAHTSASQAHDLSECKAELEGLLGESVQELAYPYGGCDFATAQIAEEVGFAIACTVEPDAVGAHSDPLRLPRLEVRGDEGIEDFALRLEQTIDAQP